MELTLEREPFLKTLARIQTVVARRNTMLILGHALLQTTADGQLQVSATDKEVSLRTTCPVQIHQPGEMTVMARKLFEIVRELPDLPLKLTQQPGERMLLTCGTARFTLVGQPASAFPEIPEPDENFRIEVNGPEIAEMFTKTHYAMSQDETRFTLSGILVRVEPDSTEEEGAEEKSEACIRLVATDTHRLVMVERPLPGFSSEAREVIVPRKAVLEARKMMEESEEPVTLAIGENYIQFIRPDITMVSKLVNGRFPNYKRVLPPLDEGIPMLVNRADLLSMVRRMTVLSNEKSRGILLSINAGELGIDTANPEQEKADEKLTVDYDGDPVQMGFNARYLYEIIESIEADEVCFRLRGKGKPVLITDAERERFLFVLMPMRV